MKLATSGRAAVLILPFALLLVGGTVLPASAGCDAGQWGIDCLPCPGGQATPCSNHGVCDEGVAGSGQCTCSPPYVGTACDQCGPGLENYPACTPIPTTTTTTSTTSTTSTTTTSTTLGEPACPEHVDTSCRLDLFSKLILKDSADDTKDLMIWKWLKGAAFDQADTDDPSMTAKYLVCLYDSTSASSSLETTIEIAAGAGWSSAAPKGWKYKNATGASDGVTTIVLKTGTAGRTKMLVKAKGANLPMPSPFSASEYFDQDGFVALNLINTDTGDCWISVFPTATKNLPSVFVAP